MAVMDPVTRRKLSTLQDEAEEVSRSISEINMALESVVTGPSSSAPGNLALFADSTGKSLVSVAMSGDVELAGGVATVSAIGGKDVSLGAAGTLQTLENPETVSGVKTFAAIPFMSAGGIKFPVPRVASSNANTLDGYAEGTFTVTDGSGAGLGIGTSNSQYIRVGSLIALSAYCSYPVNTDTNYAIIILPFSSNTSANVIKCTSNLTSVSDLHAYLAAGSSAMQLKTGGDLITNAVLSGKVLAFSAIYRSF